MCKSLKMTFDNGRRSTNIMQIHPKSTHPASNCKCTRGFSCRLDSRSKTDVLATLNLLSTGPALDSPHAHRAHCSTLENYRQWEIDFYVKTRPQRHLVDFLAAQMCRPCTAFPYGDMPALSDALIRCFDLATGSRYETMLSDYGVRLETDVERWAHRLRWFHSLGEEDEGVEKGKEHERVDSVL